MATEKARGGKALVLGGGGVTGVAWETGLLFGLAEKGVDLTDAGLFVGTSAGSVVAAQVTSGTPLSQLYEAQVSESSGEIAERMSTAAILQFLLAAAWPGDRKRARARLGRAALRAKTVPAEARLAVIADRLPSHEWPQQSQLLITAVEAETGEDVVFTKESGVALVDAVAASCAVPLVWPPISINGHHYIDGGVRSTANADLATGCAPIVILAPIAASLRRADSPAAQIAAMEAGVQSIIISPDAAARVAIGSNVLDPAHRAASAQAGRAQATTVAEQIRAVWV
ncbi:MAG: patatin-like phospholipase family protein [Ktedonobacterales bacterium]|nr:patatin-like phospholipase family protein [Ktedonobacterales bacterium]